MSGLIKFLSISINLLAFVNFFSLTLFVLGITIITIWYKSIIKWHTPINFLEKIINNKDWIIEKLILNNIITLIIYSLHRGPLNNYIMSMLIAITYIYTFNCFKKILERIKV